MRHLSKKQALEALAELKREFREIIKRNYEHRAKSCVGCTGECCIDEHFVNVHITKLEAELINAHLEKTLDAQTRQKLTERAHEAVIKYQLDPQGETSSKTFACPFFQRGFGCLIHDVKPLACIHHACYEDSAHLPPDDLLDEFERKIERLNERTYGKRVKWLPLPIWFDYSSETPDESAKADMHE